MWVNIEILSNIYVTERNRENFLRNNIKKLSIDFKI